MDFFNKLGNMASETYKYTADKKNKRAKEAKTRMKILWKDKSGNVDTHEPHFEEDYVLIHTKSTLCKKMFCAQ